MFSLRCDVTGLVLGRALIGGTENKGREEISIFKFLLSHYIFTEEKNLKPWLSLYLDSCIVPTI